MEPDDDGVREAPTKAEQVVGRGAGEGVDRLVGVADHAQVVAAAQPGVEQALLQRRDVLVLVDDEVPVPAPDLLGDVGGTPRCAPAMISSRSAKSTAPPRRLACSYSS